MTRRFLLSYLFLIGLTLFIFGLTTTTAIQRSFESFQEAHTAVHTHLLVDLLENHYQQTESWAGVQAEIVNLSLLSGFVITLKDRNGTVVGGTFGTAVVGEPPADLIFKLADAQQRPLGTLYVDRANELQAVDDQFAAEVSQGVVAGAAVVLGLAVVLAVVLAHSINYPIRQMGQAAAEIARGHYAVQVQADGPAEIGTLGRAFNQMAASLHHVEQTRRDLVQNVSHDLRTPLTTLRGYLEGLQTGKIADRRAAEHAFAAMEAEVSYLLGLVNSLSTVAALDAAVDTVLPTTVDMAAVLQRVQSRAQQLAQAQGVALTTTIAADLPPVQGNAMQLEQMMFNLVENGVRHTAAGGSIHLGAQATAAHLHLSVADTGEGIPPAHHPFVFERFYRVDGARSRHNGGAGLGLAIVQGVVQAHGGRIALTSSGRAGEGAQFDIWLPR